MPQVTTNVENSIKGLEEVFRAAILKTAAQSVAPQKGGKRKMSVEKTYHRWSAEEDARLMDVMKELKDQFESIGQPGGINRNIFWAQIPGKIGVMATALACAMRYRTLTSPTQWAEARRRPSSPPPDHDSIPPSTGDLPQERFGAAIQEMQSTLAEVRDLMAKLVDVWTRPSNTPVTEPVVPDAGRRRQYPSGG